MRGSTLRLPLPGVALATLLWAAAAAPVGAQTPTNPAPAEPSPTAVPSVVTEPIFEPPANIEPPSNTVDTPLGPLDPSDPITMLAAIAAAAALGGFLGAAIRRPRAPRFERTDAAPVAPRASGAPRPRVDDARLSPEPPPLTAGARATLLQDAETLFTFFRDRFGLREPSAEAAIDYLSRLSGSIDALREKLSETESALDAAHAALESPSAGVADGLRAIRSAQNALRGDVDYAFFAQETGLEDTLRPLAELRVEQTLEPETIDEAWPHRLFRAEALSAFYPNAGAWRDLRFGLGVAAADVRRLMRAAGVYVDQPRLLQAHEPKEAEIWSTSPEGLRDLGPVREAAQAAAQRGGAPMVIDYESFGHARPDQNRRVRSKVILFDPKEWSDA